MTDKQIGAYIDLWSKRLQLAEWVITWDRVPAASLAEGQATVNYDLAHHKATIVFADDGVDDGVRFLLREEMVHIALADMREAFEHVLNVLGAESAEIVKRMVFNTEEHVAVRFCRAFDSLEHIGDKDTAFA